MVTVSSLQEWMTGRGYAPRTIAEYTKMARRWHAFLDGRPPTATLAREWSDGLPLSRSSRKMAHAMLKCWCAWTGVDDLSPAVRMPRRPRPQPEPLEPGEVGRLLAAAELVGGRRGLAVTILVWTGLRAGEVAQLRWENVGTDELRAWRDKVQDWHVVPVHPRLAVMLDRHRKPAGALFAGDSGVEHIRPQTVWRWCRDIARLADVDAHPQRLRVTFGSTVLEQTGQIDVAAELLGHANIDTTRRHYVRTSPARKQAGVASLPW